MKRQEKPNISFARKIDNRAERARRAEFNIEKRGVRQKMAQQIPPFLDGQVVRTAFARIACRDDERRPQHRQFFFVHRLAQGIEAQLEKIWRFPDSQGTVQIDRRSDYADEIRPLDFDPSPCCHTLDVFTT